MSQTSTRLDTAGRRTRLREYQAQLLERMQSARTAAGTRVNQLGVLVGPDRLLLDLTQAGEIVTVPAITPVPLTQPWYLGLANIRGNLVGIIDLARYLATDEAPQPNDVTDTVAGPDARIVTFAPGLGFNCALLVSRVYGLRHAAGMQAEGSQLADADGNLWTPFDLAALVRETRFLHVGF